MSSVDKEDPNSEPGSREKEDLTVEPTSDEVIIEKEYRIEEKSSFSQEGDDSVSSKARESANSLRDLMTALAKKTKATAQEKTEELKEAANNERPLLEKDATDIGKLGVLLEDLTTNFDDTMDDIRNRPIVEQEKLLIGYKKMLAEELNVISARLALAKRMSLATTMQSSQEGTTTTTTTTEAA